MRTLRVNQPKVTLRNAFIDNVFALEKDKESRNDENIFFWDYPRILDLAVNPYTANASYVVSWTV